MNSGFPLFPPEASTMAARVDALFLFWSGIAIFFVVLIYFLVIFFAVKYRRRSDDERPQRISGNLGLEIFWTAVPLGLLMILFVWGAKLFFVTYDPPSNALEINVVGRQWMWKIQHPEGQREINELHVPTGRPVRLRLTSEDVIHDFFIPAFRVKKDVLPGRYTTLWFEATQPGDYHLFCSQYCGTQHAGMIGHVIVMKPGDYANWLRGSATGISLADAGERLFQRLGCESCHTAENTDRGPSLVGLFGSTVKLQAGQTAIADENYIRESILNPRAKIVAGYQPIMPTFKGLISEDSIFQIITYIQSLKKEESQQAQK